HQSLWSTEGECLFLAGDGAQEASFWAFLSGQLAHFEESAALYLPTINAYKRIALRRPEPLLIDWAFEDRSAAIRVLGKSSGKLRVENRAVGGEANPYLALAASLACGFGGLETADAGVESTLSTKDRKAASGKAFPSSLEAALVLLNGSTLLREWIGPDLIDAFVAVKRAEVRRFHEAVTDWELQEYLHDL
ncbi:MAG: glutamine synthetase, partial [Chloroflexi bacterium]|nr:glutamine synthetase [Chloroflexota bacterium]